MAKDWYRVKIPRITHVCCGYKYDNKDVNTINYFRCFAHKPPENNIVSHEGQLYTVKFCITVWLVCKNNNCVTAFTYYYDYANHVLFKEQISGLHYIESLKSKFLDNISLNIKTPKIRVGSKKYLWRYTDRHPKKAFVSNIYDLDDRKVGETLPQEVSSYKL